MICHVSFEHFESGILYTSSPEECRLMLYTGRKVPDTAAAAQVATDRRGSRKSPRNPTGNVPILNS